MQCGPPHLDMLLLRHALCWHFGSTSKSHDTATTRNLPCKHSWRRWNLFHSELLKAAFRKLHKADRLQPTAKHVAVLQQVEGSSAKGKAVDGEHNPHLVTRLCRPWRVLKAWLARGRFATLTIFNSGSWLFGVQRLWWLIRVLVLLLNDRIKMKWCMVMQPSEDPAILITCH